MGKRGNSSAYKSNKEVDLTLSGKIHLLMAGMMLHGKSDHRLTVLFLCLICKVLNQWTTYSLWQIQKPLYKLDLEWPKFSEEFTGQTFCVAVDHLQGLVYVGQVRNNKIKMFMKPLLLPKM